MTLLEELKNAIIDVEPKKAEETTHLLLNQGVGAADILNQALIPGMDEVGRLFKEGEYYVPEVLVAAKAMNATLNLIEPLLVQGDVPRRGKIVIGTVEGDLHDIGKNLVSMMWKGAGYTIVDLGVDVTPDVKVLVGGAPLTQPFANEIGADGYAADATDAVSLVRRIDLEETGT